MVFLPLFKTFQYVIVLIETIFNKDKNNSTTKNPWKDLPIKYLKRKFLHEILVPYYDRLDISDKFHSRQANQNSAIFFTIDIFAIMGFNFNQMSAMDAMI